MTERDSLNQVIEGVGEVLAHLAADDDVAADRAIASLSVRSGDESVRRVVPALMDNVLETRARLHTYRRRSMEFSALYDTTIDLSVSLETNAVLARIVARGKSLLGTDTVYLLQMDSASGEFTMRVSEGTVSADFTSIRVPSGAGLVGLVARDQSPHWTTDYSVDTRFLHSIDDRVSEEGLISLLGVPLRIGDRLIGVLFAADRRSRIFTPDEISLLSLFAAHAAIAMNNAALIEDATSALADSANATRALEVQNRALTTSAELTAHLGELVLQGRDIAEVGRVTTDVLTEVVLTIFDPADRFLVRSGNGPRSDSLDELRPGEVMPLWLAEMTAASVDSGGSTSTTIAVHTIHIHPVLAAGRHLGTLVFLLAAPPQAVELQMMAAAATATGTLLTLQLANAEADNRVRGELLTEILAGPISDPAALILRATLLGATLDGPMSVLVVRPVGHHVVNEALRRTLAEFTRTSSGLITTNARRATLLVPGNDCTALGAALLEASTIAGNDVAISVGVAGPTAELGQVTALADEATRYAEAAAILERTQQVASQADLGIYGFLLADSGIDGAWQLVRSALQTVIAYDTAHGSSLMQTMEAYYECEENALSTARRLFVHVNTFYQRAERLDQVIPGWRKGEKAITIRIALRLRSILSLSG